MTKHILCKHLLPILTALLLLGALPSRAQQMPVLNQYIFNGYLYNPALTGVDSLGNIYINHRQQWTKMPQAPLTSTITMDAPLFRNRIGLGVTAYLDQIHLTQRLGALFSYAYHLTLSKRVEHKLSIGMSLGFVNQQINITDDIQIDNPADQTLFGNQRSANAFDMSFGLNYRWKNLNLGFSIPQLGNTDIRYLDNASGVQTPGLGYQLNRHYYGRASYRIPMGQRRDYTVEPGVLVRVFPKLPTQVDVSTVMRYRDQAWFGVGWRLGNDKFRTAGLNGSVGFQAFKIFTLTFTYENVLDGANRQSLGHTMEFLLGVKFGGAQKRLRDLERRLLEMDDRMVVQVDSVIQVRTMEEREERQVIRETIHEVVRNETTVDERMRINNTELNDITMRLEEAQERIKTLEERIIAVVGNQQAVRVGQDNSPTAPLNQDTLSSVYFMQGSDFLTDYSKSKLNLVGAKIVADFDPKKVQIMLYGNASAEGDNNSNLILSLKRAKAVKDYLLGMGIAAEFIITVPNGEDKPITPTQETEEERKKNRRVDILIIAP